MGHSRYESTLMYYSCTSTLMYYYSCSTLMYYSCTRINR